MILTVEVIDNTAINTLNDLESKGLIHVKPAVTLGNEKSNDLGDRYSFIQLRGIHENIPGASVEEFLARCREDKEYELAIEKRQEEGRTRLASAKLHS
jgi:hypothetical protein